MGDAGTIEDRFAAALKYTLIGVLVSSVLGAVSLWASFDGLKSVSSAEALAVAIAVGLVVGSAGWLLVGNVLGRFSSGRGRGVAGHYLQGWLVDRELEISNPNRRSRRYYKVWQDGRSGLLKLDRLDIKGESRSLTSEADFVGSRTSGFLCQVLDAGQFDAGRNHFVVYEWLEGTSLKSVVEDGPTKPSFELAIDVFTSLLEALDRLEKIDTTSPILHGDIAPSNVMVCDDGSVILADYEHASRSAWTAGIAGLNAEYTAPEVLSSTRPTSKGDLFSVASTSLFSWSGTGWTKRELVEDDLGPAETQLLGLLRRATAQDAQARPSLADARAEAFAIRKDLGLPAPTRHSQSKPAPRPTDKYRTAVLGVLALSSVLSLIVVSALLAGRGEGAMDETTEEDAPASTGSTSSSPSTIEPVDAGAGTTSTPETSTTAATVNNVVDLDLSLGDPWVIVDTGLGSALGNVSTDSAGRGFVSGSYSGMIYSGAVDSSTTSGSLQCDTSLFPGSIVVFASIAQDGSTLVVGGAGSTVALNPDSCEPVWSTPMPYGFISGGLIDQDSAVVYVAAFEGSDCKIFKLDLSSGELIDEVSIGDDSSYNLDLAGSDLVLNGYTSGRVLVFGDGDLGANPAEVDVGRPAKDVVGVGEGTFVVSSGSGLSLWRFMDGGAERQWVIDENLSQSKIAYSDLGVVAVIHEGSDRIDLVAADSGEVMDSSVGGQFNAQSVEAHEDTLLVGTADGRLLGISLLPNE